MSNKFAEAVLKPKPTGTLEGDRDRVRKVLEPMAIQKKLKVSSIIRGRMGLVAEEKPRIWFPYPTRERLLEVISDKRGFFSGQIIELAGEPSGGKSSGAMDLMGQNQVQDGINHWIDFENSRDERWFTKHGVDYDQVNFYYPELVKGKSKKKKAASAAVAKGRGGATKKSTAEASRVFDPGYLDGIIDLPEEQAFRIISAEEVCSQVEAGVMLAHSLYPGSHQLIVLDSVAATIADKEAEAGVADQNMATGMALTQFMKFLLRRWIALFPSVNATLILINQIRIKPGMVFGDPSYTPGGRALEFYPHARVRVRPMGKMIVGGRFVGNKGLMRNYKNKAGGTAHAETGFKHYLEKGKIEYCPIEEVRSEKA